MTKDSHILKFFKDSNNEINVFYRNILTNQKFLKNIQTNTLINFPANPLGEIIDIFFKDNSRYLIGEKFYYKEILW